MESTKPILQPMVNGLARWLHSPPSSFAKPARDVSISSDDIASQNIDYVKVICISDTHNTKPVLASGDILLHAGDLSQEGTFEEIQEQLDWLNTQPHAHVIVVAGNHDIILDDAALSRLSKTQTKDFPSDGKRKQHLQWGRLIYLEDSVVELIVRERKITVYGCPMTPKYGDRAFQYPPSHDIWHGKIPDGADIAITHGPPRGHMDPGHLGSLAGCPHLLRELHRAQPKVHVFGHVHEGRGQQVLRHDPAQEFYDNIICAGEGWYTLGKLVYAKLAHMQSSPKETLLVNAAIVEKPPYVEKLPATIIEI